MVYEIFFQNSKTNSIDFCEKERTFALPNRKKRECKKKIEF